MLHLLGGEIREQPTNGPASNPLAAKNQRISATRSTKTPMDSAEAQRKLDRNPSFAASEPSATSQPTSSKPSKRPLHADEHSDDCSIGAPSTATSSKPANRPGSRVSSSSHHGSLLPTIRPAIVPKDGRSRSQAGHAPAQIAMTSTATTPVAVAAAATAGTPAPAPTTQAVSMTSKQWVVPPRPKPGRKPATDTPPTKRKAQNRAAQRAFRERRAARVGELEEHIQEQREEHERIERELQDRIVQLELEAQSHRTRCVLLQAQLERETAARAVALAEAELLRKQLAEQQQQILTLQQQRSSGAVDGVSKSSRAATAMLDSNGQLASPRTSTQSSNGTLPHPRPDPRTSSQTLSIAQIISHQESSSPAAVDVTCGSCTPGGPCQCVEDVIIATAADAAISCGKCSFGTPCECLEAMLRPAGESTNTDISPSVLKRPHSPSTRPSISSNADKKIKSESSSGRGSIGDSIFSPRPSLDLLPGLQSAQTETMNIVGSCGFCKDGMYCHCADQPQQDPETLPSVSQREQQQTFTPPPETVAPLATAAASAVSSSQPCPPEPLEITPTGAVKLRRREQRRPSVAPQETRTTSGGCGPNGPGTCAQCRADPTSGLFCRSLAATFERSQQQEQADGAGSSATAGGCCGRAGGCCKASSSAIPASAPSENGPVGPHQDQRPPTHHRTTRSLSRSGGATSDQGAATPAVALVLEPTRQHSLPQLQQTLPPSSASGLGVRLSCSDAYRTLKAHPKFPVARDHMGSWLPKLRAAPVRGESGESSKTASARSSGGQRGEGGNSRPPIEVESASILSVLRDFDVRF